MDDNWHLLARHRPPPPTAPEPLSAERIDAGYRLFWTKMALAWDGTRCAEVAARVAAVIARPDFENNALERRFYVEGLDDLAHSGASLLALAEVLRALAAFDADDRG